MQGGGRPLGLCFLGDFHTLRWEREREKKKKRHLMQAESRNSTGTSDLLSMLSRTTSATTAEHFNWAYFVLFSVSHTQKDSKERRAHCSNS